MLFTFMVHHLDNFNDNDRTGHFKREAEKERGLVSSLSLSLLQKK